ncbi:MAG: DNA topoisomerase 4 subunit A [Planctomycetales bacterium]|nr:DNA topoisomerase 4 subunit A [Planctomycetales bacterium]
MAKRNSDAVNVSDGDEPEDRIHYVSLGQETRRRYLNYAMSVITSRALPDVRDGLKPVQRRILYVMFEGLRLTADSKPYKCAKIAGDTSGDYHPHGPMAIYDALVRMAQDFTLRYPLIHPQGNFGSIMGLPAAADRYTEARLTAISEQLMTELRYQTVEMRPNYDGRKNEPVVLPAQFPNLLVNGATGIAVGMATNIPPHNLGEVIAACLQLIDEPESETKDLLRHIKGPDFPLGGRLMTDRKELRTIYEEGRGSMKVRAEWRLDKEKKAVVETRIVIYSLPYGVDSGPVASEIGAIVNSKKVPQLIDSNDETDDKNGLRIVLDLKPGTDPATVMTYLYKHTALEQNFAYNPTCLVPDEHGTLGPLRLNLVDMVRHFLTFRLKTVRLRFEFQLRQHEHRIHILEGFALLFNDLDRALKIIRASSGKRDAAEKLMKVFPLDEEQTMAILELQLYRISTLEINTILDELGEQQKAAEKLRKLLASEKLLWKVIRTELEEFGTKHSDKRRTAIGSSEEIVEFDAATYIVKENTNVVLTREGWIKRVGRLQSVETTRVREGDSVLDVIPGSTTDTAIFFAADGVAYTLNLTDIPASSGYGEPISKHVKLGDGINIVAALSTDARFTPADAEAKDDLPPSPYFLALTLHGQIMRLPLSLFRTPSTKSGRKYCRLVEGDRVVWVELVRDATSLFVATKQTRVAHFAIDEVPILSGAGKGVRGIKLSDPTDQVLGAAQMARPSDCLRVQTSGDKVLVFGQMKYELSARGGKGVRAAQRSTFIEIIRPDIQLIDWAAMEG